MYDGFSVEELHLELDKYISIIEELPVDTTAEYAQRFLTLEHLKSAIRHLKTWDKIQSKVVVR